jgi:ubiquinone/menaquinone biosynthesis C-methylase UbiE
MSEVADAETSHPTDATRVAEDYDRWAASYDTMTNQTRDLDALVMRRASLCIEGRDVLEIGAGTGKNTVWLGATAHSVVAMDFSAGMLARARERVGAMESVRFVQHNVCEPWPIPSRSVDVVVANLILEHVHDLRSVFCEASRALRPGGQLFFCELHPYRQLKGKQAQFTDPATGATVLLTVHVHTVSEYANTAIQAGFVLREMNEVLEEHAPVDAPPRLLSMLFDVAGVPTAADMRAGEH